MAVANEEPVPIQVKDEFQSEHWTEARTIIKSRFSDSNPENMPNPTGLSSREDITAAQLYCLAVVENPNDLEKMPRYVDYMEHVRNERKR